MTQDNQMIYLSIHGIKDGKESDAYVASRHRQFQKWQKLGTKHIYELDTEQALAKSVDEARRAIWESL